MAGAVEQDNCTITPVISKSSADFIEGLVKDCEEKGAKLLQKYRREGNLIWPLLIDHVTPVSAPIRPMQTMSCRVPDLHALQHMRDMSHAFPVCRSAAIVSSRTACLGCASGAEVLIRLAAPCRTCAWHGRSHLGPWCRWSVSRLLRRRWTTAMPTTWPCRAASSHATLTKVGCI